MKKRIDYLDQIILLIELVLLNIVFNVLFFLRFNETIFNQNISLHYTFLYSFVNVSWILIAIISKSYKLTRTISNFKIAVNTFYALFLQVSFITIFIFFLKLGILSREFLAQLLITFSTLTLILKLFIAQLLKIYRRNGRSFKQVIVYGNKNSGLKLSSKLVQNPQYGLHFIDFFDSNEDSDINHMLNFVKTNNVNEIYCGLPSVNHQKLEKLIHWGETNFVQIKLFTECNTIGKTSLNFSEIDGQPIINLTNHPLNDFGNQFLKRCFDLAFSLGVIIFVLSWLVPFIGILIKLESRGPIFFKQKRTGLNGYSFDCYKLRSMRVNNDSDKVQASKTDSRITKIGKFIRKTSIDELPQFFNVLMGNMSIVGPRPHMEAHTGMYANIIQKFMKRHSVKPGITGLAQVSGYRGETENDNYAMRGRVRLDLFYINNWNFPLDLKIIIRTATSMVLGDKKAY
ncbi:undecaprenyl-phosphate glucose phosphotransferase [Flammeovirga sp. SJP92]|uniref:undecaprenyl-phosphate glucose phosphotransferase n=1 Tax=Flammeovirga sp. SJP92 TaxID=1775430 RepID=UPI000787A219|nr:undecaprenyl-phosphate glucose phosphotransferase [Flammeovirga sp. SJP92]KXX72556.1 hypothetical protein AVL50_00360 [Flammeovirga sp. SJP92]